MYERPLSGSFSTNDEGFVPDRRIEDLAVKIARLIAAHEQVGKPPHVVNGHDPATTEAAIGRRRAEVARQRIRERRQRDLTFESGLFGEPAWDILLDLFVAAEDNKEITISSLCIAAATPPTTALRWINELVERGMLVRRDDERDRRRVMVQLHPNTHHRLSQLLAAWDRN